MSSIPGKLRAFLGRIALRHVTMLGTAILLLALFAMFHLLGWRDDTAIISGTSTSPNANATAIRGVLYALTYFLAVIVSPILILAAGINAMLRRLTRR